MYKAYLLIFAVFCTAHLFSGDDNYDKLRNELKSQGHSDEEIEAVIQLKKGQDGDGGQKNVVKEDGRNKHHKKTEHEKQNDDDDTDDESDEGDKLKSLEERIKRLKMHLKKEGKSEEEINKIVEEKTKQFRERIERESKSRDKMKSEGLSESEIENNLRKQRREEMFKKYAEMSVDQLRKEMEAMRKRMASRGISADDIEKRLSWIKNLIEEKSKK